MIILVNKRGAIVLSLILTAALHALAATPGDYKLRIDAANSRINELIRTIDAGDATREQEQIDSILKAIPQSEKIEWPGGGIETDNYWLKADLEALRSKQDAKQRSAILSSISERLAMISRVVGELERSVTGESTKDANKQKLAEILAREEYQRPHSQDESLFQKWWREFREWLEKQLPAPTSSPAAGPDLAPLMIFLQVAVFAVVIGLIGFLLWRFVPYFLHRLDNRTKKEKATRIVLGEIIGEDRSSSDLFNEAERLARDGDLRGAIRKGYIAVLCELGDRKVVRLAKHKTNRDYLRDVRSRKSVYTPFIGLTDNFERTWYGLREAEPSDWEDFRLHYRSTLAEVKP